MPMTKVTGTVMATMGFGQDDLVMDTAVSAYWRWRFQEKPPGRTTAQQVDVERKAFRRAMGSAYRAFRNGDDMTPFLVDALQIQDFSEKSVRASLRRRRLLASLKDEEQISLRDRIGDDAFDQLSTRRKVGAITGVVAGLGLYIWNILDARKQAHNHNRQLVQRRINLGLQAGPGHAGLALNVNF